MNKNNKEKLITDFPDLFREFKNNKHSGNLGCMDGWFNLIYELSEKISKTDPNCVVVQIKEKFGGLRFYTAETSDSVYKLISDAEMKSYTTCEICGTSENVKMRSGSWIHTFCDNCNKGINTSE